MSKLILSSKYKTLAACFGLGMLPTAFSSEFQDNNYQFQSLNTFADGIQKCPETVTAYAKAYGLIIVDWSKYAPDTNAYVTVTVVPHTVGISSTSAAETTNKGSLTLEGYRTGHYTVYYTVYPASTTHTPCTGMEPRVVFL